jgi:hypothetical protein
MIASGYLFHEVELGFGFGGGLWHGGVVCMHVDDGTILDVHGK